MNRISVLSGAVALLAAAAALGQGPDEAGYRIGPKDLIVIRVFEVPEIGTVERRVREDGTVSLPTLGEVAVQGLTTGQLATRLKDLLESRYVQRATVDVQIQEFRSRPITVIGAVRSRGPLDFSGSWTLLEALAAAGGLAENHGNLIYVLRRAENGLSDQIAISVKRLMVEADPQVNIPIFANDLINVAAAEPVTIFFLGEVQGPGALTFQSTERITLLTAIARAGGLTDRAARKIVIKRQTESGKRREIVVDYKRILNGKDSDVELEAGDIVVVKESFL